MSQLSYEQKRAQTVELAYNLFIVFLIVVVLMPVFYIISISFSKNGGIGGELIPTDFSLNHWKYILGLPYKDQLTGELKTSTFPILKWMWNSLKIAGLSSFMVLFLSTTSAYALSRFNFKGKQSSLITLMIVQMFPNIMALVAFYLMLDFLGQYVPALGIDTHWGLILVYLGGTPFNIWLIKGYFDTIPRSMEESAIIDGCSHWQAFTKILLPLSAPILAVVGLLTFIGTFADFIVPSILLKSQDQLTFAVGIQLFISDSFAGRWGQFAAASILGALPISLIFFSIHRYIISGLSAGGVKE
jgi:maltose/maltodextrin transport system permease protein